MEEDSVVAGSTVEEERELEQKKRGKALDACRAALGEVNLLGNVLGLVSSSHLDVCYASAETARQHDDDQSAIVSKRAALEAAALALEKGAAGLRRRCEARRKNLSRLLELRGLTTLAPQRDPGHRLAPLGPREPLLADGRLTHLRDHSVQDDVECDEGLVLELLTNDTTASFCLDAASLVTPGATQRLHVSALCAALFAQLRREACDFTEWTSLQGPNIQGVGGLEGLNETTVSVRVSPSHLLRVRKADAEEVEGSSVTSLACKLALTRAARSLFRFGERGGSKLMLLAGIVALLRQVLARKALDDVIAKVVQQQQEITVTWLARPCGFPQQEDNAPLFSAVLLTGRQGFELQVTLDDAATAHVTQRDSPAPPTTTAILDDARAAKALETDIVAFFRRQQPS